VADWERAVARALSWALPEGGSSGDPALARLPRASR
jgi:hypothetical protein